MGSSRFVVVAVAVLALLAGCTSDDAESAGPSAPTSASASPAQEPSDEPTPEQEPETEAEPAPPHPVSIEALAQHDYDGRGLRVGRSLGDFGAYTRHYVTYLSGDLRISGVLNVPAGRGPFPALVLNHGYIDPADYVNGQGLSREQDYLARRGYVVLHTDYRNHAGSDADLRNELRMRLGYTEDVINAVLALRRSGLPVDDERIGLLGRSMGGGVTYNVLVAEPGLVDAAVVFAPVSSDAVDNFDRWIRDDPEDTGLAERILERLRLAARQPAVLAAGVAAAVLRPDHRAGADPPRHGGHHLPAGVVGADAAGDAACGRARPADPLARRGARVHPAVGAVDAADGDVPRPEPALSHPRPAVRTSEVPAARI